MLTLTAPCQQRLINPTYLKDIYWFIYLKFLQRSCFKLQQIFRVKVSEHLPLIGLRHIYLTLGLMNYDAETLYPPNLPHNYRANKDIICNISCETTFLVILKVELPQLKLSKTLKKSKILQMFADVNKMLAFFALVLLLIKTPTS